MFCTAHNFNVVPLRTDRDILVSAWYNGGTTVLDFTDPANPQELGYLNVPLTDPSTPISATWSSYSVPRPRRDPLRPPRRRVGDRPAVPEPADARGLPSDRDEGKRPKKKKPKKGKWKKSQAVRNDRA